MPVGELAAVLAAITWAVGAILFARIGREVPPGAMNLGKLVAAGVFLSLTRLVIAPVAPLGAVPSSAGVLLLASAIVGLTIGDTAYFAAMEAIGVSRAILMLSSAPVFTAIGGYFFLHEKLGARSMVGIAITLAGVLFVVLRPSLAQENSEPLASDPPKRHAARGLVFGLVAALGQASGSLFSRRAMQAGIDPLAASAGRVVSAAVVLILLAVIAGRARGWIAALRRDRAWLKVSTAAMLGTYCGVWLSQVGIARASSAGVAATLLATTPVFALPIAHYSGVERATGRAVLGALLTVLGIAVLSTSRGG